MTLAYSYSGQRLGETLVLLNSLGTSSEMWSLQMDRWSRRFRILSVEHPGHGGSGRAEGPYTIDGLGGELVSLLDQLGEGSVNICGLSLGGMVGMWVASRFPDRVKGLVVACSSVYLPTEESWRERAEVVRAHGSVDVLADALLARWFTPVQLEADPAVGRRVLAMISMADPEGYAGCCEAIGAMDMRGTLTGITARTLVIAGAEDPVTPPSMMVELLSEIPGSSFLVLPHAAHLANLAQPTAFALAVENHLLGTEAERGNELRRTVLGDPHVDRSDRSRDRFNSSFIDFITENAWGDVWTRPGLDRRSRSMVTIALLAGLGHHQELKLHVKGALRNGLTSDEIAEVLLHSAIYAGVPASNTAFAIAREAIAEHELSGE